MSKIGIGRLGKEIKISPKSHVWIHKAGIKSVWEVDTIQLHIGIGKDHMAKLTMTTEAWKALQDGQVIDITTTKEFLKK